MRRTTLEARKPASFHSRYTAPVPAPRPAPAKQPRTGWLFALFFAIAFALTACWALPSVQSALEDGFRIFGSDSKARHPRARRKAHGSAERFLTFTKPTPHGRTKRTRGPTWPPPAAGRPA